MMYVPRADQSQLKGAPPPVDYNPFAGIQHDIVARAELVEREIQYLERVVTLMLARRHRDD